MSHPAHFKSDQKVESRQGKDDVKLVSLGKLTILLLSKLSVEENVLHSQFRDNYDNLQKSIVLARGYAFTRQRLPGGHGALSIFFFYMQWSLARAQ